MAEIPLETPLQAAQKRLTQACLQQPLSPQGAAISAYINTTILSARVDALQELWLNPPNGTWTPEEALEAAITRRLLTKAEQLEAAVREAPRIVRPD